MHFSTLKVIFAKMSHHYFCGENHVYTIGKLS